MDPAFFVGKVVLLKWLNDFVRYRDNTHTMKGPMTQRWMTIGRSLALAHRNCSLSLPLSVQFDAGYSKVEQTCTGAMHCQVLDAIYPYDHSHEHDRGPAPATALAAPRHCS